MCPPHVLQFMLTRHELYFNYDASKLLLMEKSFKENTKNITNFLKLLKTQIIEKKFQNMLKEVFTSVPKYSILHKEKKNKYNTADQTVDMQAINFVLMKHN